MDRAKLICKMPPGIVMFDYNPNMVTFARQPRTSQQASGSAKSGSPSGSTGTIFRGSPQSQITLANVTFTGEDTKARCDTLLGWMSPAMSGLVGAALSALGVNLATKLPTLTFQWGPPMAGFMYDCTMENCSVKYLRFDASGVPIRARVDITLREQPSLISMIPTNPTSGGLPGRQSHVVSEGENLQQIATTHYGEPNRWRALADANGIDDPMRVRPGTTVFLPNAAELAG